ncbi:MAG: hypothetical protein KDD64_05665 [Bdellovibrionales bacterium]|nr:hypothetical protein [Bdellovibrionales bacterium]
MSVKVSFVVALFALCFLTIESAQAQSSLRQARICNDLQNNQLVLKRRCKNPRYEEVTPDSLVQAGQVSVRSQVVSDSTPLFLSTKGDLSGSTVFCPEGMFITGGGASIVNNNGLLPKTSIPRSDLTGWSSTAQALQNEASGTLNIYAVCATGVQPLDE